MAIVKSAVTVTDVTRIPWPGVDYVYRAVVPIDDLYELLRKSVVRYAPRYQRGFKNKYLEEKKDSDYDVLLPITDPTLQIDEKRAASMAVKYLMAYHGYGEKHLFNSQLFWNARIENGNIEDSVTYDAEKKELAIHTVITVPDSGHRHYAFYLLGEWYHHPEKIPTSVDVDGDIIDGKLIREWIDDLDLDASGKHLVYCDIYTLDAEKEGWLFDEFNADAKKPSPAIELDMNWEKNPERRFVKKLMDECPIFARDQLEIRSTTIAEQSRKLTTTSTLVGAIKPYQKKLSELEKNDSAAHQDLVDFFKAFYTEWANHFPVFQPNATGRPEFRKSSMATQNIMYFPMFKMIIEMWDQYRAEKTNWKQDETWKKAIAKMAADTTVGSWTGPIMARANPAWEGKILIQKFDPVTGDPKGSTLSSTRQTRDAAYGYLKNIITN